MQVTTSDIISLIGVLLAGNGLIQYLISRYLNSKEKKSQNEELVMKTLSIQSYCNLKQECTVLIGKGYATEPERRFLHKMYKLYKAFGWNGDMDNLIKTVDELPYSPPLLANPHR